MATLARTRKVIVVIGIAAITVPAAYWSFTQGWIHFLTVVYLVLGFIAGGLSVLCARWPALLYVLVIPVAVLLRHIASRLFPDYTDSIFVEVAALTIPWLLVAQILTRDPSLTNFDRRQ